MSLNKGKPLFHLDLHGKKDRKKNSDIDLGVKAILEGFKYNDRIMVDTIIRKLSQKLNKVFSATKLNGHQVVCNPHGELQGRWPLPPHDSSESIKAKQVFTMTQ